MALVYGEREITYKELLKRIEFLSTRLDINAGDRVAILSENRPEWIYAFYAAWRKMRLLFH